MANTSNHPASLRRRTSDIPLTQSQTATNSQRVFLSLISDSRVALLIQYLKRGLNNSVCVCADNRLTYCGLALRMNKSRNLLLYIYLLAFAQAAQRAGTAIALLIGDPVFSDAPPKTVNAFTVAHAKVRHAAKANWSTSASGTFHHSHE
jgi:hypothetical protein